MTYRIKRSIKNGLLKFYPQYRRWFWWHNLTTHGCYSKDHARLRIKDHMMGRLKKELRLVKQ